MGGGAVQIRSFRGAICLFVYAVTTKKGRQHLRQKYRVHPAAKILAAPVRRFIRVENHSYDI